MSSTNDHPWLVRASREQRPRTLYAFPYAGGDAQAYLGWASRLDASIEWITLELPGRGSCPATSYADIQEFVQALVPLFADCQKPFAFFGHSFGALLSFLICRALAERQLPLPCGLILSGCKAPAYFEPVAQPALSDDDTIALIRAYGGTPEVVLSNRALMSFFLPTIKADLTLVRSYRWQPQPSLPIPLLILSGRQDSTHGPDVAQGWRDVTSGETTFQAFDGGHFFIKDHHYDVLQIMNQFLLKSL
ncbi:thioesterase [Pseudomonas coronafaciens pv. porri]|uniref:Thioesterase n=1 Tax=Pseudomonas coronafaciens pv. porri TaxID=83964 RepID=A0ABR5JUJ2_9PSED|nr:alpha/beta fold hydrolase [Pseudomonas coronafaciens]KOP55857.1 thioesterase [Pseudomonas coronafaciens pv. porri]KOP61089.1 thioesterase [Pseudomonas coronafaciens pv. porri]KPY21086.1 CFA synthetase, thioesterase component [Pseudomonas coronafaciens pv. porri]RMU85415.1 CFA synthetase, thioesterase component [Pseudomonas coronafaciens pv. porri]RMV98588.1 CFA synthetase, thioesterase component [Pseudomonas coronafaciens pv. porri]